MLRRFIRSCRRCDWKITSGAGVIAVRRAAVRPRFVRPAAPPERPRYAGDPFRRPQRRPSAGRTVEKNEKQSALALTGRVGCFTLEIRVVVVGIGTEILDTQPCSVFVVKVVEDNAVQARAEVEITACMIVRIPIGLNVLDNFSVYQHGAVNREDKRIVVSITN